MRKFELEVITDITTNNSKKPKLLYKNARIKKMFDLDNIELEEYIEPTTGKHVLKYASVYYNNVYYKVNIPYEQLRNLVLNNTINVLGLAYKSKKYK